MELIRKKKTFEIDYMIFGEFLIMSLFAILGKTDVAQVSYWGFFVSGGTADKSKSDSHTVRLNVKTGKYFIFGCPV